MNNSPVTIYTTRICPYCIRAKMLLQQKQVAFDEIAVDANPVKRDEMRKRGGGHTVPQIWIGDRHVGGSDDLYALERQGKLDHLLFGEAK